MLERPGGVGPSVPSTPFFLDNCQLAGSGDGPLGRVCEHVATIVSRCVAWVTAGTQQREGERPRRRQEARKQHSAAAAAIELENPCGRSAGYRLDDHVRVVAGELLHIRSVSRRDDAASQSYRGGNDDAVDDVT